MKKVYILFAVVLLAAGCSKTTSQLHPPLPEKATNPTPPVETIVKAADTNTWQTFSTNPKTTYGSEIKVKFAKNGFSFKHPEDWPVDLADNPRAVLVLHNPNKSNTQIPSFIGLFPAEYIDFTHMDDIAKANYPASQAVTIAGLDVFKFQDTTDQHHASYHINFPDKSGGLDFVLYPNINGGSPYQYAIFDALVKTFTFTK